MIDVDNAVRVYEVNRSDCEDVQLRVKSHWAPGNCNTVILQLANGLELTVLADDLIAAIKNATNRGAM